MFIKLNNLSSSFLNLDMFVFKTLLLLKLRQLKDYLKNFSLFLSKLIKFVLNTYR